jgi:hypothetical protein
MLHAAQNWRQIASSCNSNTQAQEKKHGVNRVRANDTNRQPGWEGTLLARDAMELMLMRLANAFDDDAEAQGEVTAMMCSGT